MHAKITVLTGFSSFSIVGYDCMVVLMNHVSCRFILRKTLSKECFPISLNVEGLPAAAQSDNHKQ